MVLLYEGIKNWILLKICLYAYWICLPPFYEGRRHPCLTYTFLFNFKSCIDVDNLQFASGENKLNKGLMNLFSFISYIVWSPFQGFAAIVLCTCLSFGRSDGQLTVLRVLDIKIMHRPTINVYDGYWKG